MEEAQEEVVVYRIFPDLVESVLDVKGQLQELQTECLTVAYPAAGEYIWQHETFNLRVCASPSDCLVPSRKGRREFLESESEEFSSAESFVPHLFGKVRYGDNLEDEWLVTFFLFEISRRIPHVSITVRDSDGEFLLIEAAYSIPKAIKPENSHNRVFIRQGHVHLVPPTPGTLGFAKIGEKLPLKQALQVLASGGVSTRASEKVMDTIMHRMKQFPEKALENVHRARCRVPLPVAQILRHEPQLISIAVESFYNRDMDAMKAASRMEKFLPKGQDGTVEMVDVVVRMSRAMYAQLVQQVFQAPRCYPMPPSNSTGSIVKEAELGMKIAVGFEIMYWERSAYETGANVGEIDGKQGSGTFASRVSTNTKAVVLTNDAGWQAFKANLEKNGYFRDFLEGSARYRELLQAAVVQYSTSNMFASVSEAMSAPVKRTEKLLSLPHGASDFAAAACEASDSDSWLYDGEKDLNAVMMERQNEMDEYEAKRANKKTETNEGRDDDTHGEETGDFQAEEVVKSMQSFVNKISSFEGAEFPAQNDISGANNDNDSISLDMSKLLKELGSVFSPEDIASMFSMQGVPDDSDVSSETDLDEIEDDSDNENEVEDMARMTTDTSKAYLVELEDEQTPASITANQADAMFTEAYSSVMGEELRHSSLVKSFLQKGEVDNIAKGNEAATSEEKSMVSQVPGISEPEPDDKRAEPEPDDENDLVDVDANLVESLLRSFMFQQGMPGPATNLLGAMGVDLPDNADTRPGPSTRPTK
ncbi:hypothetical protein MPTK1_6g12030 [Marchantia polymorpha subsp. ruderalis]|uniref:Uncharacterized protein n=2 Tax=Marchantia polymorpha TaxID=3197 RepID=A0A176VL74_MARPO|nr:hypothetical protein AXG93_1275s1300 [Marchantia polymorpha subsp. ruderalis]PTQ29751.1 hypothetical protein MARPO_0135s0033 [Marchantia polymorpha]BBN14474.1 hypothetical protein Mp_6g12030 [Marchantia polymorpha subsp. ruderalis]|eukprot:PTQ29751.1 hypothetical protein MARPO_0135s0033 [Marchantia polymorpha]